MKKLSYLVPLALTVAAIAVPAASTAPSPVSVSISSNARYVSPTAILVQLTVTCPAGQGFTVIVEVFEPSTSGRGFGALASTCTGNAQTLVLTTIAGPFAPGKAFAWAQVGSVGFFDTAQRQIQIGL